VEGPRLKLARRRQRWLFLLFVLFGGKLAWSLVDIQILSHASYLEAAERQQKKRVVIQPRRGTIYDRNGVALASVREQYQLYLVPRNIGDVDRFVRELTAIVPYDEAELRARIAHGGWYVRLLPNVPRETIREIQDAHLDGVGVETVLVRHYPYGELAADLLGRVDVDNVGIEGVELFYDEGLRGRPGYAIHQRDALGREYANFTYPIEPPVHGKDVHLTIDLALQEIAEGALDAALERTRARSASLVVVDPRTGEVLALANAAQPGAESPRRNFAVVDQFEPGSTFKIVTLAGLYEEELAAPQDSLFCENGSWVFNGRTLRDVHPYGWLSVEQVIEESSNICAAKLAGRLGDVRLHDYARRFGFGLPTGIDFPGEPRGLLKRPEQWSALTPASIAMGYEVMVTSLQMAMGYAAIANGGDLMRPYLVRRVVGSDGRTEFEGRPQRVRRVVSPATAHLITQALVRVVETGTARSAHIDMLPIAGKTGTARKTVDGGYVTGLYTSSFVGFFPANEPRYVAFVRVDEPRGEFYGGTVAAPVFRQIVESSLLQETITRSPDLVGEMRSPERVVWTASETFGELSPPPAPAPSRADLAEAAAGADLEAVVEPPAELSAGRPEPYVVDVVGSRGPGEAPYDPRERVKVPDFAGLSLREAVTRAARVGLELAFSGTGRIAGQSPEAGELVARGEVVRVANP
jgi:cell division protein FtsI (penicillin-binding protein 3)